MKVLEPWDNFQHTAGPDFGGIKLSDFKKQQQQNPHNCQSPDFCHGLNLGFYTNSLKSS